MRSKQWQARSELSGLASINLVVRASYTQNAFSAKDKDREKRGNRGRAQERRKEERFVCLAPSQLFPVAQGC